MKCIIVLLSTLVIGAFARLLHDHCQSRDEYYCTSQQKCIHLDEICYPKTNHFYFNKLLW